MASDTSPDSTRPAEKGVHGARLGEPYVYRWIDQEPTKRTWTDLANRRGCLWAAFGLPVAWFAALLLGGVGLFSVAVLLSAFIGVLLQQFGIATAKRGDGEPVPKPVRREAYIEFFHDRFFFVLEENGRARIWQPWELVRQFEKVEYWSMFGDAGASPYKTGWHAIAMTPLIGAPWLIGSTIESESAVRERFTELDARFSADTRARFMRAYDAQNSAVSRHQPAPSSPSAPASAPTKPRDVPEQL